MQISAIDRAAGTTDADTIAIGIFDGESPPPGSPAELGALLDSGEAQRAFKSLALTHADGKRWLLVGLGRARSSLPSARAWRRRWSACAPVS